MKTGQEIYQDIYNANMAKAANAPPLPLAVGEIVYLNSGSMPMTVMDTDISDGRICVNWIFAGQMQVMFGPPACFTRHDPSTPASTTQAGTLTGYRPDGHEEV